MVHKSILITGASTGLGEAAARALMARGHRVYAGVRTPADARRLQADLGKLCTPLLLDVTQAESIETAISTIEAAGPLDVLVNNAGVAICGPLEFLSLDEIRAQFDVNVFGVVAVTQAALPLLRRSRGRILIVGSVAGRNAMPLLGPYCASKHAIEAIVAALRMELASSGIKVALIEPGTFRTPLWQRSDDIVARVISRLSLDALRLYGQALNQLRKTAAATGARGTPASKFGEAIAAAVESTKLKRRYVLGGDARLQLLLGATPMGIREPLIGRALQLATGRFGTVLDTH